MEFSLGVGSLVLCGTTAIRAYTCESAICVSWAHTSSPSITRSLYLRFDTSAIQYAISAPLRWLTKYFTPDDDDDDVLLLPAFIWAGA